MVALAAARAVADVGGSAPAVAPASTTHGAIHTAPVVAFDEVDGVQRAPAPIGVATPVTHAGSRPGGAGQPLGFRWNFFHVGRARTDAASPVFEESADSWSTAGSLVRRNQDLVRDHELEIFVQTFPRTLLAFTVLYCMLACLTLLIYCWLALSFIQEIGKPCDTPLRVWTAVDFCSTAYHLAHAVLLRCFTNSPADGDRIPCSERVHLAFVTAFDFIWFGFGIFWIGTSETCEQTSPALFRSLKVYIVSSSILGVFVWINAIGLYTVINQMVIRGVLRTNNGAPPETLKSLRLVKFDPELELYKSNPECCICLSSFNAALPIRATTCNHAFHEKCLGKWLILNRTCPLCRHDLAPQSSPPEPEPEWNGSPSVSQQVYGSRSISHGGPRQGFGQHGAYVEDL